MTAAALPLARPVRVARPTRLRHGWLAFLLLGVVVVGGYELLPAGIGRDAVYVGVALASAAAIFAGVIINQPVRRLPWLLMGAGTLLWAVADGIGGWESDIAQVERTPSAADPPYLLGYLLMIVALVLLIRGRRHPGDHSGLVDSAIVTVGLGVLSWVLVLVPAIDGAHETAAAAAVAVAYPVIDIVVLSLLVGLVGIPGGRTPALRLLLLALVLLITADTLVTGLDRLTWGSSHAFDGLWLASYFAWGAAALHPSMYWLSSPTGPRRTPFTRARLVALAVALVIAPATLAVQQLTGSPVDLWAGIAASTVMFLLVVARMKLVIDQLVTAHAEQVQLRDHLAHQASHDALTGLPNRAQALRLITGALSRGRRSGSIVALLFIDLDGFKHVNDTFGHRAGDDVLRTLAGRMATVVRDGDVVARLGGDEFVVLLEPVIDEASAVAVAERLVRAASRPILLGDGETAQVGASIGVAVSQDGSTDADTVLHEADVAAYRAKAHGRGRVEVFDAGLRRELRIRTDVEAGLAQAIDDDELLLHYQPIIDISDGSIEGYEALVRWHRPGVGLVPPMEFLPIAEQSDLICDLDTWVLRSALGELNALNAARGDTTLTMAVNISGRHASRPRIRDDVRAALRDSGVDGSQLVLELTETSLGDDLAVLTNLHVLRELGVVISIDDFGTGYNSIARLQQLPVDVVKIDRKFLAEDDPSARPLLNLMVQAAHAFGLPVVAEGVEQSSQLETLRALDCESAQGFFLGRPQALPDHTAAVGAESVSPGSASAGAAGRPPRRPGPRPTRENPAREDT